MTNDQMMREKRARTRMAILLMEVLYYFQYFQNRDPCLLMEVLCYFQLGFYTNITKNRDPCLLMEVLFHNALFSTCSRSTSVFRSPEKFSVRN